MKNKKLMRKQFSAFFILILLLIFSSCSLLPDRESIIKLYQKHEEAFAEAAVENDFTSLEKISGVAKVSVSDSCVDIFCGGSGFGSSTSYYGIFYSESDDLTAIDVAGENISLEADGDGYRYSQPDGDNEYYVEPLGNHYFYYEAHF